MIGRALLLLAAAVAATPAPAAEAGPEPVPFAPFELPLVNGSRFASLDEFRGKPLVVHYWRTDCPACLADARIFNEQAMEHPDFGFVGIAVDERTNALRFLKRNPPTHLQLYAPLAQAQLLHRAGNHTAGLPYTVVLDATHMICARKLGKAGIDWLEAAIARCGS